MGINIAAESSKKVVFKREEWALCNFKSSKKSRKHVIIHEIALADVFLENCKHEIAIITSITSKVLIICFIRNLTTQSIRNKRTEDSEYPCSYNA